MTTESGQSSISAVWDIMISSTTGGADMSALIVIRDSQRQTISLIDIIRLVTIP